MSKGKVVDPIDDEDREKVYALANLLGMCIEGGDPVLVMRALVVTTASAMVTMTADTRNTVELLERAQNIFANQLDEVITELRKP